MGANVRKALIVLVKEAMSRMSPEQKAKIGESFSTENFTPPYSMASVREQCNEVLTQGAIDSLHGVEHTIRIYANFLLGISGQKPKYELHCSDYPNRG